MTKTVTDELRAVSDDRLREVLAFANPMVLMALVYHATQEPAFRSVRTITVPAGLSQANVVASAEDEELVRAKAFDLLRDYRDGRRTPPANEDRAILMEAMALGAGEQVPAIEFDLHKDVLSIDADRIGWDTPPEKGDVSRFPVIVIGAGLAGINAAIVLKASGIPFELLEKSAGPGGTWFKNRYPGARVDWPSRLYSHSFGVDYPFQHTFAPRAENEQYLQWCVETYGIAEDMRFGVTVHRLAWIEEDGLWEVHGRDAEGQDIVRRARAVISAIGLLDRPNIPSIPGMADFKGTLVHSSLFDPATQLKGRRVAVVGTGASGLQMVPDLAPLVDNLSIFQRSPAWVVPAPGYRDRLPDEVLWLEANVPFYTNWSRFVMGWILGDHKLFNVFEVDPDWPDPMSVNAENQAARNMALAHLREKLAARPDLIAKSIPDYPIFANRPVIDNGWFDALLRDNVELVTEPIARITPDGIETADGRQHPLDVIVMATGFDPNDYFSEIEIVGRGGVRIADLWAESGPQAFWGVMVPHMPNFFMLYGPNANPRNLGPVQYGEWALHFILQTIRRMVEEDRTSIEVSDEAYRAFNDRLVERLQQIVSVNPRTTHASYYITKPGRSAVQSPWSSAEVRAAFMDMPEDAFLVDKALEPRLA